MYRVINYRENPSHFSTRHPSKPAKTGKAAKAGTPANSGKAASGKAASGKAAKA